ncbi:MAG: polysaccharide pyruvyl transferase family protein [Roseomonas sp.]|nr:polysaccharide pyruvyl transferase family protein [Roseomonas sp.]
MKRLKVVYFTLKQHGDDGKLKNIGDRVIFLGVRNIMRCALGPHDEEICFLDDDITIPKDVDIAVICGMPQILNAKPEEILNSIAKVASMPIPIKLNLGAGSFYFDAFGPDRKAADMAFADRVVSNHGAAIYREYNGFDAITCRDHAGALTLEKFGVTARALPCPGFFSTMFEPRPLLRSGRELVSSLNGTASFWNTVRADVHNFYRSLWEADNTRVFISHDYEDSTMLADLGIPFVEFNDAEDFVRFLAGFDRILSLRVHGALPSWTLGLDVTLLGLDRRALLGEDFGAKMRVIPLRSEADMSLALSAGGALDERQDEKFRQDWLLRNLSEYVDLIRLMVGRKLGIDFSGLENDPLGGLHQRKIDAVRGTTASGLYFSELFVSCDPEFEIPLSKMRSNHHHEKTDDKLIVVANGKLTTLAFGPYIRIPAGHWRLMMTVAASNIMSEQLALTLTVSKGIPGLQIARKSEKQIVPDHQCEMTFDIRFENPSATGDLEFVLSSPQATNPDAKFTITKSFLQREPN